MKHSIILCLVLALTGCGFGTPAESQKSGAGREIDAAAKPATDVVDAFHKALTTSNTNQALALLADNVLIYESGGAEASKAEYASNHLAADMAFLKNVTQSVSARSAQANGDTAVVMSQGKAIGTYKDKALDSASTETMVLHLIKGQWKIVHIHWSSANNKPKSPTP
jgi:ketosteroid isomerase-like protein